MSTAVIPEIALPPSLRLPHEEKTSLSFRTNLLAATIFCLSTAWINYTFSSDSYDLPLRSWIPSPAIVINWIPYPRALPFPDFMNAVKDTCSSLVSKHGFQIWLGLNTISLFSKQEAAIKESWLYVKDQASTFFQGLSAPRRMPLYQNWTDPCDVGGSLWELFKNYFHSSLKFYDRSSQENTSLYAKAKALKYTVDAYLPKIHSLKDEIHRLSTLMKVDPEECDQKDADDIDRYNASIETLENELAELYAKLTLEIEASQESPTKKMIANSFLTTLDAYYEQMNVYYEQKCQGLLQPQESSQRAIDIELILTKLEKKDQTLKTFIINKITRNHASAIGQILKATNNLAFSYFIGSNFYQSNVMHLYCMTWCSISLLPLAWKRLSDVTAVARIFFKR